MGQLISIGELIIDFSSLSKSSLKDTDKFLKNAGGAPANVCAQVCKLNQHALYLSMVGDDGFGDFLIESLKKEKIDTTYVKKSRRYDTSLSFVSFKENGEREFAFYRRNAADLHFTYKDFENVKFQDNDIFEFGSVALNSEESRLAHKYLIDKAKKNNCLIAFDPNVRLNLWDDPIILRNYILEYLCYTDILKISDEELLFITNYKDITKAIKYLFSFGIKLILLTKGCRGADLYLRNSKEYTHQGYKVDSIDTTGAGDSFFGAFITKLLENKINATSNLDLLPLDEYLDFACKCGAITTTNYGSIAAMKNYQEIENYFKR